MSRNLIIHQSIKTSLHKAKAARPFVEKLISLAKLNTLDAKRRAFRILGEHKLVTLLFGEIAPRFANIKGGYTRIINLERRRGDNAQVVIFQLTEIKKKEDRKPKAKKEVKSEDKSGELTEEKPSQEKKLQAGSKVQEKPPLVKKPSRNFLGGLRNIFKKERDSL